MEKGGGFLISVIIVTKDRADALETISLPSLLKQRYRNFEVIVWDASEDNASQNVVSEKRKLFQGKGILLQYFKAPRTGIVFQRNDAIRYSKGEVVFFIDDDSEVSPDGLEGLSKCFENDSELMGAGLFVTEEEFENRNLSYMDRIKDRIYPMVGYVRRKKVSPSGSTKGMYADSGPAEWLSGCSMAFRSQVFEDGFRFNEKLQTFGPYANGEDVEFSHRVFLHYGKPLFIAKQGFIFHRHPKAGLSEMTESKLAMMFLSRYLIMNVASIRSPVLGRLGFGFTVLKRFIKMGIAYGWGKTWKGFRNAVNAAMDNPRATNS